MNKLLAIACLGLLSAGLVKTIAAQSPSSAPFYKFKGQAKGQTGDGNEPTMLIQAKDGNSYGITSYGGDVSNGANCTNDQGIADGCGTIFSLDAQGNEAVLHSFSGGADGGIPSSLVQGPDGKIYVTTLIGGPDSSTLDICQATDGSGNAAPCCLDAQGNALTCGAIFEFDPSQAVPITLNPLYTFSGGGDGASPGTLIVGSTKSDPEVIFGTALACSNCGGQDTNGNTIDSAGYNIFGTVFSFVPNGSTTVTPTTVVTFPVGFSLAYPNSLIQADQNTLYGTTQMGGAGSSSCPTNENGTFGCGGLFRVEISSASLVELCDFGSAGGCANTAPAQSAKRPEEHSLSVSARPDRVIKQSGSRFPVGGNLWNFFTTPIELVMDGSGNIHGTTPPGCAVGSDYSANPNCPNTLDSPTAEPSSIFEFVPPSTGSTTSTGTLNILYTFSGNYPSSYPTPAPSSDGGGTVAGLTLATDGNFYGLSGDGSSASELFELPLQNGSLPSYVSLAPAYSPNWMIQGNDGNFYGTSSAYSSGQNQFGAVFQVIPPATLPAPVQVTVSPSQINIGSSAVLTATVPNAFSLTSQQCYAFEQGANASSLGVLQNGSVSGSTYSGSITITPAHTGNHAYGVTCGGINSGWTSAPLTVVIPPFQFSGTTLPNGVVNQAYSASVAATGGEPPYSYAVAAGSSLPPGLNLSANTGAITGSPANPGAFVFSITATDAESPAAAATASFNMTVMGATPSVTLTLQPNTDVTYGQSITLTATESPVEGIAQGYSWAINEDGQPLVSGAPSNGSGTYVMTASPATGQHTFSATFSSTQKYSPQGSSNTVSLTVAMATPSVTAWPTASALTVGQALSSSTLTGGTASVAGAFAWTAPATVPPAGNYSGSVTFTPADTADYNTVTGSATVIVNPLPGFTLSSSPGSISVAQGGSATSTITITAVGGFSGSVTLSATGIPSGVTPSFAPGSAAGTQVVTLTASTSAAVTSGPATVTITGTSGTLTASTSVALTVTPQPSFTPGAGGTTSMTVTPGATSGNSGTISVVGTNGFSGTVSLSCSVTTSITGVNDMPGCSLNPGSVILSGSTAQTSTLTVTTTAAMNSANQTPRILGPISGGGTALALLALFLVPRTRRNRLALLGLLVWAVFLSATGCGGGPTTTGGGNPGTTPGAYTITVTGTSGSASATVGTITLTVQ